MVNRLSFLFSIIFVGVCFVSAYSETHSSAKPVETQEEYPSEERIHALFPETHENGDASLPQAQESDRFFKEFLHMLLTLGAIIALIFFISWFLKRALNARVQKMNEGSEIKILERRFLTPKTSIYLLDIRGKGVVIAEAQQGVSLLSVFELEKTEDKTFYEIHRERQTLDGPEN